eukprot:SAG11_NODE_2346_length_3487_cov_1.474026_4_plen_117_part_00
MSQTVGFLSGTLNRKAFGLLNSERNGVAGTDTKPTPPPLPEDDADVVCTALGVPLPAHSRKIRSAARLSDWRLVQVFARQLFDAAAQRLQLADGVLHVLNDESAKAMQVGHAIHKP